MPIDTQKLTNNKEKMISFLRINGPSLPVRIAKAISSPPLFASAFLSELYNEKRIKMTDMKVGSSPLYYLQGQESTLEKFTEYLNQREKEAFSLLKKELLLDDESLSPVMRVAIRSLKDFAIPIRIRINGELKLFWKYFMIEDSKIKEILENKISISIQQSIPAPIQQPISQPAIQTHSPTISQEPPKTIPIQTTQLLMPAQNETDKKELKALPKLIEEKPKIQREKKTAKKKIESKFAQDIQEYLKAKDIEIIEAIEQKKKEFTGKIRVNTIFGKQEFYLIAKNKKKITETDLTLALQKANSEKMLSIIMAPGELDKKAIPHLKEWRNILKFEKLNF